VLMGKVAAGLRPPIPDHPFPLYEDLVLLMQGECVVAMPFPASQVFVPPLSL
jgi:hypothetical protein